MAKPKRKLTAAEKAEKKRLKRPPTIDGMDIDEFIRRNAEPIWLHQNEMWEYMDQTEEEEQNSQQRLATDAEDGAVEG